MLKPQQTILLIDDNHYILKPLSILLGSLGYSVKTASYGNDPAIFKKPAADLILLDMRLQGIGGADVCLNLKKHANTKHIPVLMFSIDKWGQSIAKEAGADDFVEKPFDKEELSQKIVKHLPKLLVKLLLKEKV